MKRLLKSILGRPLTGFFRVTGGLRRNLARISAHARLAADLAFPLPASTVIEGRVWVFGSRRIRFGQNSLLYPALHLETQGDAVIEIGDGVVISRGAHLVAMAGITIGDGTMIGEYTSIRDANHSRDEGRAIRESGHSARPIAIGREVWIGRGVTVLGGVTIGDHATIGANAVVTHDVAAGAVVGGVPAVPLRTKAATSHHGYS